MVLILMILSNYCFMEKLKIKSKSQIKNKKLIHEKKYTVYDQTKRKIMLVKIFSKMTIHLRMKYFKFWKLFYINYESYH